MKSNSTMTITNSTMTVTQSILTTTESIMTTAVAPDSNKSAARGFIACAVAVVFFGSNFIPVKKFHTGDGLFFQWIMCGAIWLSGLVINCIQDFPTFYPLAMVGGLLWTTGNLVVVPIIHMIGLSQGLLVWASFNLVSGWVSGRFGLFGIKKEVPPHTGMNYIGMALCFCSAFLYTLLKTNVTSLPADSDREREFGESGEPGERSALLDPERHDPSYSEISPINSPTPSAEVTDCIDSEIAFINKLSPRSKRICGLCLAVVAGLFFGVNFTPVIYIQDNYVHNNVTASKNGLDYVFSHFSGLYASSTMYFIIYCAAMKNRPRVYPRVILPAFISGVMWAIADAAWFVANADLSEPVAFPIISSGPGMVGVIWGLFLFKEITGKRNYLILALAFSITIAGSVLTGFSHQS